MKSDKNKTIDFDLTDGMKYLERCVPLSDIKSGSEFFDVTIYGNSFDALDKLPKKCADLVIVDPYYNLNKKFKDNSFYKTSDKEYIDYTVSYIEKLVPLMKDDASIYVCCDWQSSSAVYSALSKFFVIRNRITWQREKGRGAQRNWKNGMEDIWFATVSDDYYFDVDSVKQRRRVLAPYRNAGQPKDWEETKDGKFRNTHPSNFWDDISIPYWSMAENTAHPTQKPEKLIAKLILASSKENALVLDPFCGSGTTSVTAKKLGRRYIGIEQIPEYCAWAEYRLEKAETDKSIQGYLDGVFWERNSAVNIKK